MFLPFGVRCVIADTSKSHIVVFFGTLFQTIRCVVMLTMQISGRWILPVSSVNGFDVMSGGSPSIFRQTSSSERARIVTDIKKAKKEVFSDEQRQEER